MPERTCSHPECEGIHYARGYCKRHYRLLPDQAAKARDQGRRRCARSDYQASERERNKRRRPYQQAWAAAQKDWGEWWERQRRAEDGAELTAYHKREERRRRKVARATRPQGVTRQFIAGCCPDCGTSVVVIRGWWHDSIRCPRCTKRRWQQNHKQRAAMRGVEYEDIAPADVFARDKRRCQICGHKTRGKYPAMTSATIDHIIPLAKGGPHLMHNLQTACLLCNLKKHTSAANDQLRLAV